MADTRFLIYAQERTGSTLLADLLDHQPEITCDAELLANPHPLRGRVHRLRQRVRRSVATHTQMAWRAHRARTRAYGFKMLVYQVERPGRWSPQSFHARGWQLLSLRRQSVWRQALSNLSAKHARRWIRREGDPAPPPRALPWANVAQELDYLLHQSALEAQDLRDLPYLQLTYEQDLERAAGWAGALAKVWAHLRLPAAPAPTRTTTARTHDEPLERVIPNYPDLLKAAAHSPYAHLLDSP